ncbi:MAG: hypothetical protein KDK35_09400 [Leptospiraceae bacterium]|nr:hypothetical protein [Leptospiraceae bacterium]
MGDESRLVDIDELAASRQKPERASERARANLLWRVLRRQPEIAAGRVRVIREHFLRVIASKPTDFFGAAEGDFRAHLGEVLFGDGARPDFAAALLLRVYGAYQKEEGYLEGRKEDFTFDVLFQAIEHLGLNRSNESEASLLAGGALTGNDRDRILAYFRAYNDLARRMSLAGPPRALMDDREAIVDEIAARNPLITISGLDGMFRYQLAQILLSQKYACHDLLKLWCREYGFEPDAIERVQNYIPDNAPLHDFRTHYAKAIKRFRDDQGADDLDILLLRTLANYFTSWVMGVSEKIPA